MMTVIHSAYIPTTYRSYKEESQGMLDQLQNHVLLSSPTRPGAHPTSSSSAVVGAGPTSSSSSLATSVDEMMAGFERKMKEKMDRMMMMEKELEILENMLREQR